MKKTKKTKEQMQTDANNFILMMIQHCGGLVKHLIQTIEDGINDSGADISSTIMLLHSRTYVVITIKSQLENIKDISNKTNMGDNEVLEPAMQEAIELCQLTLDSFRAMKNEMLEIYKNKNHEDKA